MENRHTLVLSINMLLEKRVPKRMGMERKYEYSKVGVPKVAVEITEAFPKKFLTTGFQNSSNSIQGLNIGS